MREITITRNPWTINDQSDGDLLIISKNSIDKTFPLIFIQEFRPPFNSTDMFIVNFKQLCVNLIN